MKNRLPVLVMVLSVLFVSFFRASAQTTSISSGARAVTYTLDQILSDPANIRRIYSGGGFGGTAALSWGSRLLTRANLYYAGGAALVAGLTWAYESLRDQVDASPGLKKAKYGICEFRPIEQSGSVFKTYWYKSGIYQGPIDDYTPELLQQKILDLAERECNGGLKGMLNNIPNVMNSGDYPTLPNDIANLMHQYVGSHPPATPTEIGNLFPGFKLDPVNENQWWDDPTRNPTDDSDGDGVPDAEEVGAGSNPDDPESKPKELPTPEELADAKNEGDCTKIGGFWGGGVCSGTKEEADKKEAEKKKEERKKATNEPECKAAKGFWSKGDQTCKETEKEAEDADKAAEELKNAKDKGECEKGGGNWDDDSKSCSGKTPDNSTNTCGDFSLNRWMKFFGSALRDVVIPCKSLDWSLVSGVFADKFPFSIAAGISGMVTDPGTGGGINTAIPSKIGMFEIGISDFMPFFVVVKTLFRVFLTAALAFVIVNKVSGQLVLS